MQAGTVRMEGSRAINGAQRPLRQHQPPESPPHPRLRSVRALFAGLPRMWGHSSRCFAFEGVCGDTPLAALPSEGCPHYYPWATRLNCIPTSAISGVQHPLAWQSPASLPADRPFAAGIEPVAADSGSNYWGSRRPLHRHKPAEPPLQQKEDTEKTGRLSAFWIGSPAGIPGGRAASRF